MLANISSGSKMPRADWEVIASAKVKFPSLPEQINTSQQQLDSSKKYKQSLRS
jgi:hypothetical protein